MTHERDQRAKEQLRHRNRVATRRVDDGDSLRGRLGEIDVVGADAGAADDAQLLRALEQLGGKLRGAASDEGVVLADLIEQFLPRARGAFVDDERRLAAQNLYALWIDFVGDEDAKCAGHRKYW